MINNYEVFIRLILSAILGGSIGIEREANNRPAGLRTHILVSVGSTLIMLVSIYGFNGEGDPARLASQVVSGIGFLGAGTILRTGNSIKGLTTAASLWVCAGIGLAIGSGYYIGGIITVLIVLISLISLGTVERKIFKSSYKIFIITGGERPGLIGDIGTLFGKHYITIKNISISQIDTDEDGIFELLDVNITVKIPTNLRIDNVINEVYKINSVTNVSYDGKIINKETL